MDKSRIEREMHELEAKLGYTFKDISLLAAAMKSILLDKRENGGKNYKEYSNEALSFLGDTIIKFLIAHHLYGLDKRKGDMTTEKSNLENNEIFHKIMKDEEESLIDFAYNDKYFYKDDPPQHEQVCSGRHDPYIEAIAAAIYWDGGWSNVTEWFENWLLPRLQKHRVSQ